jgi:quercetin dioxygenase-like cupin family protein
MLSLCTSIPIYLVLVIEGVLSGRVELNTQNPTPKGAPFYIAFKTSGASDIAVQDVALSTGGFSGWHYHPGLPLATVTEGSVEWYDANCGLHVYGVGDSFIENNEPHTIRNVAPVRARLSWAPIAATASPHLGDGYDCFTTADSD